MVDLSATDIATGLESGDIDAAMLFDPNAFRFQRSRSGFVSWNAQGGRRALATVYTTRAFIDEHPDAVDRYVRALVDAERYQAEHEEDAKRVFADAMGYDDDTIGGLWPDFSFGVRLDQELFITMEDQARWNIENGLVEAKHAPNYLGIVHYSALEKADVGAVTIIRP